MLADGDGQTSSRQIVARNLEPRAKVSALVREIGILPSQLFSGQSEAAYHGEVKLVCRCWHSLYQRLELSDPLPVLGKDQCILRVEARFNALFQSSPFVAALFDEDLLA